MQRKTIPARGAEHFRVGGNILYDNACTVDDEGGDDDDDDDDENNDNDHDNDD